MYFTLKTSQQGLSWAKNTCSLLGMGHKPILFLLSVPKLEIFSHKIRGKRPVLFTACYINLDHIKKLNTHYGNVSL